MEKIEKLEDTLLTNVSGGLKAVYMNDFVGVCSLALASSTLSVLCSVISKVLQNKSSNIQGTSRVEGEKLKKASKVLYGVSVGMGALALVSSGVAVVSSAIACANRSELKSRSDS